MAFQLGDITAKTEAGVLKGVQREIACDCWFTSKGKTTPRMIKVMDGEGMLYTIADVVVLSTEEKTYSGIPTVEHICKINLGNVRETVKLVYTKEDCKWALVEL